MPSIATPTAGEDCCAVTITSLPAHARSAGAHDPQQHRELEALAQPGGSRLEEVPEPQVRPVAPGG